MISELLRPQYEWALRGGLVRVPPTKKAYSPTHTHRLPNNNKKKHSRRHKHTCLCVLKLPLDKMYFWNCIFDQMYEWINKVQIMWHNNVFHIFVWLSKRTVWCRMLTCFCFYILPIKSINPCGTFVKLMIAVRRLTLFYSVYRLCLHLPGPQPLAGTQYS